MTKQRADLTFKDNLKRGRHGWVRLTPAYSVKVVQQILDSHPEIEYILDPFSGTGTTGLVAAQRGLQCDLWDINPFLIWLANVKCANYTQQQLESVESAANHIVATTRTLSENDNLWMPPISNIHRWWSREHLDVLSKIFSALNTHCPTDCPERDLLLIAFCRLIIHWSNAAFNHQSMSFKADSAIQMTLFDATDEIYQSFTDEVHTITATASPPIKGQVQAILHDSRHPLPTHAPYDAVITSPPYCNRMSYIRELRPYMYWLGYLQQARAAGELDWTAIGGTWGIATSRLNDWHSDDYGDIPQLSQIVNAIRQHSAVLSRYVHKYFVDIAAHFNNLQDNVVPGGRVFYIIGNSKFYDTLVPAEQIYAELMAQSGFMDVQIKTLRKRNSKKELYEYLVSARKSFE